MGSTNPFPGGRITGDTHPMLYACHDPARLGGGACAIQVDGHYPDHRIENDPGLLAEKCTDSAVAAMLNGWSEVCSGGPKQ